MAGNSNSGGHNSKSPEEHRAKGTFQKVRHDGFETPDPPKGRPEPPKPLKGDALAEWDRMIARLEACNTLAKVDDAVLYQEACLFAEIESLKDEHVKLQKLTGELLKVSRKLSGFELVEGMAQIANLQKILKGLRIELRQSRMSMRQYLVEFGQTPGSRTRVKVTKTPERKSKLLAFTGGKKPDKSAE